MKGQHEFDDLIRARLQGLDLHMEDAHWQDMQRMIVARRRRRRGVLFLLFGALLGLGGGAWLHFQNKDSAAEQVAVKASTQAPIIEQMTVSTNDLERTAKATGSMEAPADPPGAPEERTAPALPDHEATKAAAALAPTPHDTPKPAPTRVGPAAEMAVGATVTHTPAKPEEGNAVAMEGSTPDAVPTTPITAGSTPMVEGNGTSIEPAPVVADAAPTREGSDTAVVQGAVEQAAPEPAVEAGSIGADTLPVATVIAMVQDSAAPAPELVPHATSPPFTWQLTGTLGAWRTRLHTRQTIDVARHTEQSTPSMGLELMRMGEHFGYGVGLHYAGYVDRSDRANSFLYGTELRTMYFLSAVDTSITVVVDTIIQGGQNYYVTTQMDTTLLVLDSDVDTLTTTTEVAGYTHIDRLSVVEMPLLFDVHTNAGRWQLGMRAGPTLGYITGASVHVRGMVGPESVRIEQDDFRRVSFGYSARCYVRYALSSFWSVGVEPGIRGRAVDVGTGPSLRPFAYGVLGSVTFLLPNKATITR